MKFSVVVTGQGGVQVWLLISHPKGLDEVLVWFEKVRVRVTNYEKVLAFKLLLENMSDLCFSERKMSRQSMHVGLKFIYHTGKQR